MIYISIRNFDPIPIFIITVIRRLRYAVGKAGGLRLPLHYGPKITRNTDIELVSRGRGYFSSWEMAEDAGIGFRDDCAWLPGHG